MAVESIVCTGGNPPECCVPIPPAFLSTRAHQASLKPGDVPEGCPAPDCGSDEVLPLFPGPEWQCAACDLVFEVGR